MATSSTEVCNMALARIGAQRINDLDADATAPAIACRLHYDQTRKALLRSHWWRFAQGRESLSPDTETPEFEWSYQFTLPNDFLRMKSVFEDNATADSSTLKSYALEGDKLLTNDATCRIRYIKDVQDVAKFDPLFIEVLVLTLAGKLAIDLSQDEKLTQSIKTELMVVMRSVRQMDREESDTVKRDRVLAWNDARWSNDQRIPSKMGS